MAKINPQGTGRPYIPIKGGTYTPDTGYMDTALAYMRRRELKKRRPQAMPAPVPRVAPRPWPMPSMPAPVPRVAPRPWPMPSPTSGPTFSTYKSQVKLQPGQKLKFTAGRGYYAG